MLLGHPVAHSLSPAFQNAALRHAGVPLSYEAIDVGPSALGDVWAGLARARGAGNVTVPHKGRAAELCDELTPLASRVGAINTFWTDDDGRVTGDNTDVGGFDAAVRALAGRAPANLRVALIGAGGSAAAVLAAVERWPGSRAAVWSRTPARAASLAARFGDAAHAVELLAEAIRDADLVVNATPIGLADEGIPMPPALLRSRALVVDLVYRRDGAPTPWVRLARARGLRADDGLTMLLEQGALAFERWLGVAPDRAMMRAALPVGR